MTSRSHVPGILTTSEGTTYPAYFSVLQPDTAMVFVHGFGGAPDKTWRKLDPIATRDSRFGRADMFLWTYPSISQSVQQSAFALTKFIDQMFPSVDIGESEHSDFSCPRAYERLLLIGHSLGGVVSRRAVVLEAKDSLPNNQGFMFDSAELRLISPAIGGVRLARWKGAIQAVFGASAAVAIFFGWSPSYQELLPGSRVLNRLEVDTEFFASNYPLEMAFRADVVWAQKEHVVAELEYSEDHPRGDIEGTTHKTVPHLRESLPSVLDFIAP